MTTPTLWRQMARAKLFARAQLRSIRLRAAPLSWALVWLAACGGGGGGGSSTPPPSATLSLSTSSGVVTSGQPITLYWSSTAPTCTASGDWSGAQPSSGSPQVTVTHNSVYSLSCGNVSATVRVEAIGAGAVSTSSLAFSSTGLTSLNYLILPIDGRQQVYDPVNGLIHSITSATSSSYPQSVVSINPTSGQVVASAPMSAPPYAVAVSADGQYLYVPSTVPGSPVQRFKVAGLVPDIVIPLASNVYVQGLSVSPTSSTTVAITTVSVTDASQLQIFDGSTPRPNSYQGVSLSPVWTADATGVVVSGGGISMFSVDANGVTLTKTIPAGGSTDGRLYGNVFYDDSGNVIDLTGPIALLGQMADHTVQDHGRAENLSIKKAFSIVLDSNENVANLTSLHATQFYTIDSIRIPLSNGLSGPGGGNLISWGSDGLAWNEGGNLVIAHGSFAQSGGSLAPLQSLPTIGAGNFNQNPAVSYVIYDAHANDLATDTCGNLYAAISDGALFFANSVLTLDAMSGTVKASNYAASNPTVIAAADDCSTIYAGAGRSNSIAQLSRPALTPAAAIPLVQLPAPTGVVTSLPFAASIAVAPGNAGTIAVAMNFHGLLCNSADYGLGIFDGATRRSNVYTGTTSGPKSVVWGKDASTLYEEDFDGIKALSVNSLGPDQATLLVPYASLEGSTDVYDLHTNLYFDQAKSRILTGEGAVYDTLAAKSLPKLPVTPVINGNGCGLYGAVSTDQQTGKVFFAEFNTSGDYIIVLSFDSQTLEQIDQVKVPIPAGLPLPGIGGPIRLVRVASANAVALVTDLGYIVALQGPMFAP
jgi:hypothetical protein